MNSETNQTEELIAQAVYFIKKSSDFVSEQAPLIVQEFLDYRLFEAICYAVLSFVIMSGLFIGTIYLWKKSNKIARDKKLKCWFDDNPSPTNISALIILIVSAIFIPMVFFEVFLPYIMDIIKITIAPRIYLLEELPKLIL